MSGKPDDWLDLANEHDDGIAGLVDAIEAIPHDILFNRKLPSDNPPPWETPTQKAMSVTNSEPFIPQPEGFDFGGPYGEGW